MSKVFCQSSFAKMEEWSHWHIEGISRALILSSVTIVAIFVPKVFQYAVRRQFIKQLSKTTNSARITVGFCHLSLSKGIFEAHDVVVHTPDRASWGWDSPLIGRCGQMRVSFSILTFLPLFGYPAKEVYSVRVSDIQMFVEKRANVSFGGWGLENRSEYLFFASDGLFSNCPFLSPSQVFNYMLLDASLDLPDPAKLAPMPSPVSPPRSPHRVGTPSSPVVSSGVGTSPFATPPDPAEEKANKLMKSFLGTFSRAGKAANESGVAGLEKVVRDQKNSFLSAVKKVQRQVEDGSTSFEDVTREGVAVMKKMKKGLAENMGEIKEKMSTFSNPPKKKRGWVPKPAKDLYRIGGVVVRNLRVFTRNMVASDKHMKIAGSPLNRNSKGWHKPILFKEVVVSAADLSSSINHRDSAGCPRIGLNVREINRVFQRRMVAETGRTNGAVLLQNAFGEVGEMFGSFEKGVN